MNKNGFIDCIDPGSWLGIQPLILKKIGGRPTNEILGTGIGAVLVGLLVQLFASPATTSTSTRSRRENSIDDQRLFLLKGLVRVNLIHQIFLMPISTALQLVGTSLIGVFAFGEWSDCMGKIIGAAAIILHVFGSALTAISDDPGKKAVSQKELVY
ncbi:hypothetical protein EfmAA96_17280 [Enterococcus faecium]|nr:hypothetical protein EfmAA96_17280 [Enterococcus faecium]